MRSNRAIQILILLALAVILAVVVADHLSTRPGKRTANPFEYSIGEFKAVKEALLGYRETTQLRLGEEKGLDIAFHGGHIHVLTQQAIRIISPAGEETGRLEAGPGGRCLTVAEDGTVLLAMDNSLAAYHPDGSLLARSEPAGDQALFTAIATDGVQVFVADAGTRQVRVFDRQLRETGSFRGETGTASAHGFIIPSLHFDLTVNGEGELWVVNPGMHAIQNYTDAGRLRGHWSRPSFGHEGFSGCCNPFYIECLPDGGFVTSEKGILRVKVHEPNGDLRSLVAAPERFEEGSPAPALAVDEGGRVMLLDFGSNSIRLFEPLPRDV
jgi:hypothetical protein